MTKSKAVILLILTIGLAIAGVGALADQNREAQGADVGPKEWLTPVVQGQARTDRDADPLPPGAVARLGTVRFRHAGWITSVAFTPDSRTLVSGSWDQTIRFWDRATGKELRRLTGHTDAILGVALSADGKVFASAGNDYTVRVWETATGRELLKLVKPEGQSGIANAALSPDGKTLATCGGGNGARTIVLWDVATGKELHVLGDSIHHIKTVAFSPDGKTLASGGWEQAIHLWDVATGKKLRRLNGHRRGVSSLAFARDGTRLVSGSHDDTIRLWDTATGRELLQLQGQGGVSTDPVPLGLGGEHCGGVYSVALSPDGKTVVSGGYNGTVRLWDTITGKEMAKWQGHSREVQTLAFAPDGKVLATAGFDHAIKLWDASTGQRLLPDEGHESAVHFLAIAPDGGKVASVGADQTVRLWDVATGRELRVLRGHRAWISCAAFAPDGRTVASGDELGDIVLWDTATGKEVRRLLGHEGWVVTLAFSPDGKALASGSWGSHSLDNSVRLWDPATGKEVRKLKEEPKGGFRTLSFSPDARTLAVKWDKGALLLDVGTGKEIRRFSGSTGFALSPDGRVLATSEDKQICLWNVLTGKELTRFGTVADGLTGLALSPDGRTLCGVPDLDMDKDKTVRVWEVLSGKVRMRFEGHQGSVAAVAFSPDGNTLVSAGEDTTLLVWDVRGGIREAPNDLSPKKLGALWADLGSQDAVKAYEAICTMCRSPKQAVFFLKEHVSAASPPDAKRVARLVADLDNDQFEVRESATQALKKLGELAEKGLRGALDGGPSAEARRRIEGVLTQLAGPITSPEHLRALRAVEVLEQAGTAEAQAALKALAAGFAEARLTQDAQAALRRLQKHARPGS